MVTHEIRTKAKNWTKEKLIQQLQYSSPPWLCNFSEKVIENESL